MMRRRAAEINLLLIARPEITKSHELDGIKRRGEEQWACRSHASTRIQCNDFVMIAKCQGVTFITSTAAEVRNHAGNTRPQLPVSHAGQTANSRCDGGN